MNEPDATLTLAARHVLPVESPPISPGRLTIQSDRILSIEQAPPRRGDIDLGDAAILPGFVNAHTHLDLPPLDDPPAPPVDQIAWLERVIQLRRTMPTDRVDGQVALGIQESLRAGTTLLADVSAGGRSWDVLAASPLRAVVFAELIGLRRERAMATSAQVFDWLGRVQRQGFDADSLRPGLSPHAPYSTVGWLYERAAAAGVPLTTHLAELSAELELLATGFGPLRGFLERLDAWPGDDWTPLGSRPADYLRKGTLKRADWLVAHGTYLDESDFWQLRPQAAPDSQRVAVAYCPRTTAYFGHGPHPFAAMIERGIAVSLGTDSLASSPSLSVLDEVRYLHHVHPDLPAHLLLVMATLAGAWALRFDDLVGSLRPGKLADLSVVAIRPDDPADPHLAVAAGDGPVVATMIGGRWAYGPVSA